MTKDFIIGILLGELIWKKMPTLSTNPCGSRTQIVVSEEDTKELEILCDEWFQTTRSGKHYKKKYGANGDKEKWKEYQKYLKYLQEKYLPKTWDYLYAIYYFEEVDRSELKKGIIHGLWNTDGCEFSLNENDIIFNEDKYFLKITFNSDSNSSINGNKI